MGNQSTDIPESGKNTKTRYGSQKPASVSLAIGVGALLYGVAQPFMGMLALKKSNSFVMLLGMLMTAAGLILTPFCRSFITLLLSFGIILPAGTTGLAFGILMSAITPIIREKKLCSFPVFTGKCRRR